ncbi:16S rRNA (cytosine1402-N4)-methyltransferase [Desulfacinum hydrothermale DSM 13146]|uniref:Ribosomal RNA small subunit methyltransferase H n=1 Tax=Desulfacinum hydrothermale DSM 13146 TaxID=1121390 RepID=A0A1W1XAJ8_9BACT|nr:16S rRNA (cytosine1402-N4)-methyltransferase [Desulfacinum hydrothermale DSM 13146]
MEHRPVLLEEAVGLLACRPGGRYVDATLGASGYAEAILEATAPDGLLLGLDWDQEAVEGARRRLASHGHRFIAECASFDRLPDILAWIGWESVDGIVLDLGVSSLQLDDPSRGLSFQKDGPLDMRLDRSLTVTAADLVNELPEEKLAELIARYGEERFSRRIARAIVDRRREEPFQRTGQLASLIASVVPRTADARRIHPATRTFLALRLVVNRELETLQAFLDGALDLLSVGGRLAVVTFHSLEDRLVKRAFKAWSKSCRCPTDLPVCRCEGRPLARLLTRKALRPSPREVQENPRARSAQLRAVERI